MNVAICDDESQFREELKAFLLKLKKEDRLDIDAFEFSNGKSLLESASRFDVILLDYQMPGLNGLDTARELRKKNSICSIIFITSFPEFMIDSFEVNTYRFLVKPLNTEKLKKALLDYILEKKKFSPIVINTEGEQIVINSEDIIYLEAEGKYCNVRTSGLYLRCSKTISAVHELLPKHCFFRTHKSYVVNMYCIKKISGNIVTLINGEITTVGRKKITEFKNAYRIFIKNFISR